MPNTDNDIAGIQKYRRIYFNTEIVFKSAVIPVFTIVHLSPF
jgi:hypothetical protein